MSAHSTTLELRLSERDTRRASERASDGRKKQGKQGKRESEEREAAQETKRPSRLLRSLMHVGARAHRHPFCNVHRPCSPHTSNPQRWHCKCSKTLRSMSHKTNTRYRWYTMLGMRRCYFRRWNHSHCAHPNRSRLNCQVCVSKGSRTTAAVHIRNQRST